MTTVRSQEKADRIKDTYKDKPKDKLDFAIVEDISRENAFDKAVKSDPPFEAVIHTASPFHFNATDVQKVCLASLEYSLSFVILNDDLGTARSSCNRNNGDSQVSSKERTNCEDNCNVSVIS